MNGLRSVQRGAALQVDHFYETRRFNSFLEFVGLIYVLNSWTHSCLEFMLKDIESWFFYTNSRHESVLVVDTIEPSLNQG